MAKGDAHAESGAVVDLAFDGDGAAVHFDEFMHQGETDSAALVAAPAGSFNAVEAFEEMGNLVLGNAGACVAHDELRAGVNRGDGDAAFRHRRLP